MKSIIYIYIYISKLFIHICGHGIRLARTRNTQEDQSGRYRGIFKIFLIEANYVDIRISLSVVAYSYKYLNNFSQTVSIWPPQHSNGCDIVASRADGLHMMLSLIYRLQNPIDR